MSNHAVIPSSSDERGVVIDMTSSGVLEQKLQGGADGLRVSEIMRVL